MQLQGIRNHALDISVLHPPWAGVGFSKYENLEIIDAAEVDRYSMELFFLIMRANKVECDGEDEYVKMFLAYFLAKDIIANNSTSKRHFESISS